MKQILFQRQPTASRFDTFTILYILSRIIIYIEIGMPSAQSLIVMSVYLFSIYCYMYSHTHSYNDNKYQKNLKIKFTWNAAQFVYIWRQLFS